MKQKSFTVSSWPITKDLEVAENLGRVLEVSSGGQTRPELSTVMPAALPGLIWIDSIFPVC